MPPSPDLTDIQIQAGAIHSKPREEMGGFFVVSGRIERCSQISTGKSWSRRKKLTISISLIVRVRPTPRGARSEFFG